MKKSLKILSFIVIIFLAFVCASLCSCKWTEKEQIIPATIDILKIGKADCIVINTGSKIVMIDTGERENFDTIHSYMAQRGYNTIDTLILTHYDKDHIGGAGKIISTYNVARVIESQLVDNTVEYISYHNTMQEQGIAPIKLSENYKFTYDSCEFKIDIPKKSKYETKQDNNSSLIISLRCGNKQFLFCGDAMELRLNELISENNTAYDLAKLPYHGNYLENYREFLSSVRLSYGIITDSKKNPASEDTLSLLSQHGITTYETRYGTVHITTDGNEIEISQS